MEWGEVNNIDCLKGLSKMESGEVDVIVTSPPYNINKDYNEYQDNMDEFEYLEWIGNVADELKRVLDKEGSLFLNLGDNPSDELRAFEIVKQFDMCVQNTIHWVKHIDISMEDNPEGENINIGNYQPINSDRYLHNSHEYIFHLTKNGNVEIDKEANGVEYSDKSNIDRWESSTEKRGRGNIWFIPYTTVSSSKSHPASFPNKLPKMCIKMHGVEKCESVLDPFAGVGSTLIASKELSINSIGFEIDEEYTKIANENL
jgi:site-specific DNA-methyltransferase (adenine-specific)